MTAEVSIYLSDKPNTVLRASFFDGECTGLVATEIKAIEGWEQTHPKDYYAIQSMIDSRSAIINEKGYYTVFHNRGIPANSQVLYNIPKEVFKDFDELVNGTQRAGNCPGTYIYTFKLEDGEFKFNGNTPIIDTPEGFSIYSLIKYFSKKKGKELPKYLKEESNALSSISSMSGVSVTDTMASSNNSYRNLNEQVQEKDNEGYDKFLSGVRYGLTKSRAESMCNEKSKLNTICKLLVKDKECYVVDKHASDHLKFDMDSRYPYTFVPCIYNDNPSYAALRRGYDISQEYNSVPYDDELFYHIYHLDNEKYEYWPDALPEAIAYESKLQKDIDLTGRAKIVVNGMKSLFTEDNEEDEAKKDMLRKFFAEFLLNTKFFKVTHISSKTGFVTAITKTNKQVLMIACKENRPSSDGLCTFIPIKNGIGIAVVGLTELDVKELADSMYGVK
jgi:hypothetical protein